MTESRTIPWKRIAVEAAAIVASILFAFAIDAWWEDRQQQEAEQVVLQTLLDDLRIKQTLLADMNRFNEAIVESTDKLLRVATGIEQKLSEDEIDRLIIDTWWVNMVLPRLHGGFIKSTLTLLLWLTPLSWDIRGQFT